jgi:RND family efflux transporter MFP subunit
MILEAEATLAAARHRQAALETAEQRLRDTLVVAPTPSAAGLNGSGPVEYAICHRGVVEGEIVRTFPFGVESTSLFRLAIDRQLKLKVTVPERHKGAVKVGQEATLEVQAYAGERFQGKVARISPAVDRASRTFQVEISVPNAERRLSPGSFARATIHTRVDTGARTVPEEALVSFAGVTKVFTLEGGKAREVHVRPGASLPVKDGGRSHTWIEIEGDLAVGARVVTSGQSKLADGTAVRVREPLADREKASR